MGLLQRLLGAFSKSSTVNPDGWFFDWAVGGATAAGEKCHAGIGDAHQGGVGVHPRPLGGHRQAAADPLQAQSGRRQGTGDRASALRADPRPAEPAHDGAGIPAADAGAAGPARQRLRLQGIDARGELVALWPLDRPRSRSSGPPTPRAFYRCELVDGTQEMVPPEFIVHLRGLSLDNGVGLSPIAYHRETIGLSLAAKKYGAAFFGNNAQPMGALEVPPVLGEEARSALRASWKARHLGKRELAILDGGMKWVQTAATNEDAQYLEVMAATEFVDICGIYRVPPHKVGDPRQGDLLQHRAAGAGVRHRLPDVGDGALGADAAPRPPLEEDKKVYFFEFLVDALLRGDLKSRYEAYAIARNWGVLSVNDIRDRENLNHVANGDIYLQPLNMIEAGKEPPKPAAGATADDPRPRHRSLPMPDRKPFASIDEFREATEGVRHIDASIRASFDTEIKAEGDSRSLTFIISTASVDRMGDTIAVDGWKLDAFRKNPVVLWAHDSTSLPVAKATKVWIEQGRLMANAEFTPSGIARFNDTVFDMLKAGFLNATSVGFAPLKYAFTDDPQRRFGIDFMEQELLEFSVVPVPANAEALIQARSAGHRHRAVSRVDGNRTPQGRQGDHRRRPPGKDRALREAGASRQAPPARPS
jgi:HK97 family phage prohead protease